MTMNQYIPANLIDVLTPQEKAKAKRLYKAYRWTWARYQALGAKQGWRCGICGRIATGGHSTLNLDHQHFKIEASKIEDGNYYAWTEIGGQRIDAVQRFKKDAVRVCWERAVPLSVRGLLCPGRHGKAGHGCCNRLLGRVDNPEWLEKARNYLLNPPAKDLTLE